MPVQNALEILTLIGLVFCLAVALAVFQAVTPRSFQVAPVYERF